MKRKTKVLIIAGACLLVVGVGTGITVHNVKVNTSTMGSDMSASEETVVADKDNNDSSKSSKETTESKDTTENTSKVEVADNSTESRSQSTEGKATGTTARATEARTESRTTEARNTESSTERKAEPATETEHSHNWVAVYKTVHHDATYKEERYVVKDAWDEDITESFNICNRCGKSFRVLDWRLPGGGEDINSQAYIDFITHTADCQGVGSSYHTESRVVGSVHHDAEYGTRQVIDKPAWDEQVIDYYKCSCGATKK